MVAMPKSLSEVVAEHVLRSTNRRVQNLTVEVADETVILGGRAPSFYVKQLALQGVREALPEVEVRNAIAVG